MPPDHASTTRATKSSQPPASVSTAEPSKAQRGMACLAGLRVDSAVRCPSRGRPRARGLAARAWAPRFSRCSSTGLGPEPERPADGLGVATQRHEVHRPAVLELAHDALARADAPGQLGLRESPALALEAQGRGELGGHLHGGGQFSVSGPASFALSFELVEDVAVAGHDSLGYARSGMAVKPEGTPPKVDLAGLAVRPMASRVRAAINLGGARPPARQLVFPPPSTFATAPDSP